MDVVEENSGLDSTRLDLLYLLQESKAKVVAKFNDFEITDSDLISLEKDNILTIPLFEFYLSWYQEYSE